MRPAGASRSHRGIAQDSDIVRDFMAYACARNSRTTAFAVLALGFSSCRLRGLRCCKSHYLPKAASSKCASLTPAFCNCSLTIGAFATT